MEVSIVTPVLNSEAHIEACVRNVADQGDVVLEHIIVDGGSTDGTLAKLDVLRERYPHVRLIPGPDRGQSDALNKGSEAAQASILGILNADDFYEPDAVRRGVMNLVGLGAPGLVAADCRVLGQDGQTIYWNRPGDLRLESLLLGWDYAPFPCNPSAYFYHKQVHDDLGGYDVSDHYAMDFQFLVSCAERFPMRYVPEHWGNFRLAPGCKSFDHIPEGQARVTAILRRHRQALTPRQRLNTARIKAVKDVERVLWRTRAAVRSRLHR